MPNTDFNAPMAGAGPMNNAQRTQPASPSATPVTVPQRSGFIDGEIHSSVPEGRRDTSAPYDDWQFRIAIFPTQENLNKAYQAVAPILDAAGVDWKILLLNGEGISTTDNPAIKWDGTKTASDRDQRGKELCVYMRRDTVTQRYEKTPLEWRNLMLSCWQALETAGVQYGYMPAPYGDKPITLDNSFPTPFSYTSNKGYDDRDGVLKKGNFNPHQTDGSNDPLYGMQISSAALQRFNIAPGTTLVLLKRQQEYLTQHYATQVPIVRESFAAITTDTTWQQRALSNLAEISQLVAPSASEELDVAGYQRQIATNKAQIDELMKAFIENTPPSVEKESLTSSKIAEYIESLLKTFNKEVNHPKANAADITDAYNKLFAAIKLTEHALSSGADKAADVNLGEHQERFDEI